MSDISLHSRSKLCLAGIDQGKHQIKSGDEIPDLNQTRYPKMIWNQYASIKKQFNNDALIQDEDEKFKARFKSIFKLMFKPLDTA